MPEMLHGDRGSVSPLISFLLQSVGLLTGGGIMLCIALFEENISVNLGDGWETENGDESRGGIIDQHQTFAKEDGLLG